MTALRQREPLWVTVGAPCRGRLAPRLSGTRAIVQGQPPPAGTTQWLRSAATACVALRGLVVRVVHEAGFTVSPFDQVRLALAGDRGER